MSRKGYATEQDRIDAMTMEIKVHVIHTCIQERASKGFDT
jgi:hypothetical protein